jgi:hypothetical protein
MSALRAGIMRGVIAVHLEPAKTGGGSPRSWPAIAPVLWRLRKQRGGGRYLAKICPWSSIPISGSLARGAGQGLWLSSGSASGKARSSAL